MPNPPVSPHSPDASQSVAVQKRQLRRELRRRRRSLSRREQRAAAEAVARQLQRSPWLWRADSIAAYWPADGELDPMPLLERAQRRRKAIYLPVLRPGNRLGFRQWRRGEVLKHNRYGIPEPQRGRLRPGWSLGMMLLPLVGFDRSGGRLGMGGGFYDRTLARAAAGFALRRPLLLGLAHHCQEVVEIPCDPWDRALDAMLTDREWIPGAGVRSDKVRSDKQ